MGFSNPTQIFTGSNYLDVDSPFPLTSSLFILPSQQQCIHCFSNLIFLGAFTRDWFTCFIDAIVYFLSINDHFVTIILAEVSVLFLHKFFYIHFSMPMFGYLSNRPINFHLGSAVQLWFLELFSESSMSEFTYNGLSSCCSSTFNLGSLLTSMAFSKLSFILWTQNFLSSL